MVALWMLAAAGRASAAGLTDADVAALGDPARQKATVVGIEQAPRPEWKRVLQALKEGALYKYEERYFVLDAQGSLVGMDGKPLLSPAGEPFLPDTGLDSVVLAEENIATIQVVIDRMDLFGDDPERRKALAMQLGNSGEARAVGLLEQALKAERDGSVRDVVVEALAKMKLLDPQVSVRLQAVDLFAESRSEAALPLLKGLAESDPDAGLRDAARKGVTRIESFLRWRNRLGYVFNGLSLASVLLIMSLGLAIIFGLMGVINMAHGEMLMLGCYTAYVMQELFAHHWPQYQDYYFVAALPLSVVVAGAVGLLLERVLLRRLYGRPLETLLVTWGLGMVMQQAARLHFGDQTSVNSPSWFRGGFEVLPGLVLPYSRIFIVLLSLVCLGAVYALLYRTEIGLKIRAVMQNRAMASCLGISTRSVDGLTFALGTALAGLAGCAIALIGTVEPELGKKYVVDAFMVVVLGGVGNLMGTVVAAIGIGMSSKLLEPVIPGTAAAVYAKVAILGLVIFFLQFRPTGIFAARGRAAESLR
jgi:urea transport system permease protein